MPRSFNIGTADSSKTGNLTPPVPSSANLFARYDASVSSSITISGSGISQWNDLSGNGRHATQSTDAYRPTVVTAGKNNRNTIAFDGANDHFNITNTTVLSSNFIVFAILKYDYINFDTSGSGIIGSDDSGVSWYIQRNNRRLNVDKTAQASMLADGNILSTGDNNLWVCTALVWEGSSSGTLMWNKAGAGSFNRGGFTISQPIKTIGAYMPGSLDYCPKGEIAEILIYNTVLPSLDPVIAYATAKWGV
jgi:hypothetical protein